MQVAILPIRPVMLAFVCTLLACLYIGFIVIGSVLCSLALVIAELAGFPFEVVPVLRTTKLATGAKADALATHDLCSVVWTTIKPLRTWRRLQRHDPPYYARAL
jgi:hypothetical protein